MNPQRQADCVVHPIQDRGPSDTTKADTGSGASKPSATQTKPNAFPGQGRNVLRSSSAQRARRSRRITARMGSDSKKNMPETSKWDSVSARQTALWRVATDEAPPGDTVKNAVTHDDNHQRRRYQR